MKCFVVCLASHPWRLGSSAGPPERLRHSCLSAELSFSLLFVPHPSAIAWWLCRSQQDGSDTSQPCPSPSLPTCPAGPEVAQAAGQCAASRNARLPAQLPGARRATWPGSLGSVWPQKSRQMSFHRQRKSRCWRQPSNRGKLRR